MESKTINKILDIIRERLERFSEMNLAVFPGEPDMFMILQGRENEKINFTVEQRKFSICVSSDDNYLNLQTIDLPSGNITKLGNYAIASQLLNISTVDLLINMMLRSIRKHQIYSMISEIEERIKESWTWKTAKEILGDVYILSTVEENKNTYGDLSKTKNHLIVMIMEKPVVSLTFWIDTGITLDNGKTKINISGSNYLKTVNYVLKTLEEW